MDQISAKLRSITTSRGRGVSFWCPGCQETHAITTNPPSDCGWSFDGNLDAPTFSPSIKVEGVEKLSDAEYERVAHGERIETRPRVCHSFVRAGRIQFLSDCTHALAGQTVDLPDLPEGMMD